FPIKYLFMHIFSIFDDISFGMRKFLDRLYKNQSLVYKYSLYFLAVFLIVFFFPRGGKFKYEYQKGKPWRYDNYYAPFDFSINKGKTEILGEKEKIKVNHVDYYSFDSDIAREVDSTIKAEVTDVFDPLRFEADQINLFRGVASEIVADLYKNGILTQVGHQKNKNNFYLVKNNEAKKLKFSEVYRLSDVEQVVKRKLAQKNLSDYEPDFQKLFFNHIKPNLSYDADLSDKELEAAYSKISYTLGNVDEG